MKRCGACVNKTNSSSSAFCLRNSTVSDSSNQFANSFSSGGILFSARRAEVMRFMVFLMLLILFEILNRFAELGKSRPESALHQPRLATPSRLVGNFQSYPTFPFRISGSLVTCRAFLEGLDLLYKAFQEGELGGKQ